MEKNSSSKPSMKMKYYTHEIIKGSPIPKYNKSTKYEKQGTGTIENWEKAKKLF